MGSLIEKYEEDIAQLKVSVKIEEQTILGLKKQIQVRDDIIEQKESRIFEEKLKMKDIEKQLLLTKENVSELEQTVEPLIMEIQEKKKTIKDVSLYLIYYLPGTFRYIVINNNIISITSLYSTYQPLHFTRYFEKHDFF